MITYQCIKRAKLQDGRLSGVGYALAPYEELSNETLHFHMHVSGQSGFVFVFGFQGVGRQYQCEVSPTEHLLVIRSYRDGIALYLQHASIEIAGSYDLSITWDADSIRIFLNHVCIINILADGIDGGRWGFATLQKPSFIPTVRRERAVRPDFSWICLGDGYSNNRWMNRHFFSWPEFLFGVGWTYLNGCVSAGNTRRVLAVANSIAQRIKGTGIIIAAGADDLIEGEPLEHAITRTQELVGFLKLKGAREIHLCAIPPRIRNDAEVKRRNAALSSLAREAGCGFIDFHTLLRDRRSEWIINGDYPGEQAQREMAREVARHLNLHPEEYPLESLDRKPKLSGLPAKLTRRLVTLATRKLGGFPTGGTV